MSQNQSTLADHTDSSVISDQVAQILEFAQKQGAEAAEVILYETRSISVDVTKGIVEAAESSESKDLSLRVFQGKKQAFLSTSDLSRVNLSRLVERALSMVKLVPDDPYCGFAPETYYIDECMDQLADLELHDPNPVEAGRLEEKAHKIEQAALEATGIQQVEASASWGVSSFWLANSQGFSQGARASHHSLSGVAIAERAGSMERDYDYITRCWQEDMISPEEIGRKAASRTLARLGARKIPSTKLDTVFESRVAKQLIGSFVGAIMGSAIARGNSFLKTERNQPVFSPNIELLDTPHLKRGLSSRVFDGEGVKTQTQKLVEEGILKLWFLNSASARQLGLTVNGFASKGFGAPPGAGPSNLTLKPGTDTLETMLSSLQRGLLITDMFGPSLNMNTGDYSVGVSGFMIEKGEKIHPVSEVTIAGNLKEMFKNLQPANDLKGAGGYDIPSLFIPNLTLAGS